MIFQLLGPCALAAVLSPTLQDGGVDWREHYDVLAYDLELAVRPETKTLEGVAVIQARVTHSELETVQLDLYELHTVLEVSHAGTALKVRREKNSLWADLVTPLARDEVFEVRVHYRGQPEGKGFDGFHWETSADGSPWINTSCQGLGAHYWYPCKASFFHPEDKPERISMAIVCPAGLTGVSNGRLIEKVAGAPAWFDTKGEKFETHRWRHDYPLETYAATLNVGPYVTVKQEIPAPGIDGTLSFHYFVLPENAEKAALQFEQVPELVRIFSEAFGPFPFPDSKFGLVETNFWGMEHSTAVAYGSSYPAWCEKHGEKDRYARRNKWFDYILIHEVAHEWWGNAVSAKHWGHFWIHEGFGTYAEGVYVEGMQGREAADRFFVEKGGRISSTKGRLYRGDSPDSGSAYSGLIYSKGACVLHTLRHYVNNDEAWWKSLREFNLASRYGNAETSEFREILERNSGESWKLFFEQWFYGEGTPKLSGRISIKGTTIALDIDNTHGAFRVPLDLAWNQDGEEETIRLWLDPGQFTKTFEVGAAPSDLRIEHLDRLLGKHDIEVVQSAQ